MYTQGEELITKYFWYWGLKPTNKIPTKSKQIPTNPIPESHSTIPKPYKLHHKH